MFTGIIESLGKLTHIEKEGTNVHFTLTSDFTQELKIDQSVAHNGVCLTIVEIKDDNYVVTAIKETMIKSNLGKLNVGDEINLERATLSGQTRMDGHIVQGHVDGITTGTKVTEEDGLVSAGRPRGHHSAGQR